ncbi:MAG: T9SS type A sorting domain-containing protein [Urechidicola sp.]|nr:T9SS type A sorting domain-containing protein [Urechidicola sp.]
MLLALIVNSNELTLDGDNATDTGNGLTITHYLELDGVLDLEGESQLIQTDGSDLATSGSGYIERDQQGTENSFTYNYWSAPVSLIGAGTNNSPFTIADVLKDGTDPANPLTPNFAYSYTHADSSLSTPRKVSTYWIWNFVNRGNAYANWNWIGHNSSLNVTEGYTMKGTSDTGALSQDQNYVFIGKPNNVLNGATEIIHTTFGVPANPLIPEISLTGNPFPSAVDANQFITDNLASSDGQLYFWEHWGGGNHNLGNYQGGYAIRTIATGTPAVSHPDIDQTGSGSTSPGQYIPVAQGFYVISSATGGDIVFNNGQRVFEKEGASSSVFFRGTAEKISNNISERNGLDKMIIRLGFESPEGYHRQIAAAFNIEGATDEIEKGYDGHAADILSNDAFFIQDDSYYVIQAYGDFNEEREIPIVIIIDEDNDGGLQKIMIDELENVPRKVTIFIKDNVSGETHNLKNNTFEINLSSGIYKERFSLVFSSKSSLSVDDENQIEDKITIYMNNSSSAIQIRKMSEININKATLYNYIGQTIQVWNNQFSNNHISLPVNETSTGVYILEIELENKIISKKLIIE